MGQCAGRYKVVVVGDAEQGQTRLYRHFSKSKIVFDDIPYLEFKGKVYYDTKSNYKEYNVFIINPKFELEQLSDLVGDSKTAIIMRTGYQLEVEKGDAWKENLTQWVERVSNINPRIQLFFIVTETKKKTRTEMAASRILMELTRKFSPRAQYAFVQIYVNDSYRKLFSRM